VPTVPTPGATLHYLVEGAGPAVLLIQGIGVIGEGWRPQIDGLKGRYTCISPDNRGLGRSGILDGALSIDAMAADMVAILNAERIDRCHVVGHSMGAVVAQALALAAPSRVASLSLLCTFSHGGEAFSLSPSMIWAGLRTRLGTRRMRRDAFLRMIMPASFLATADLDALTARLAILFGHDLNEQPPIVMKQLRALLLYDARDRLARLSTIPTLVVSAKEDIIARPTYGRALAAAIPGSRYVEMPNAAHALPIQCADAVNGLLVEHFTRAEDRPA
jgi:3-oxoadipate enol-lactonase